MGKEEIGLLAMVDRLMQGEFLIIIFYGIIFSFQ